MRRRAQAYVGTFLRRSTPAVEVEDVTAQSSPAAEAPAEGSDAEPGAAKTSSEDAAAGLHEVGTFCQVEMIAETDFGAQLLLQVCAAPLKRRHTEMVPEALMLSRLGSQSRG